MPAETCSTFTIGRSRVSTRGMRASTAPSLAVSQGADARSSVMSRHGVSDERGSAITYADSFPARKARANSAVASGIAVARRPTATRRSASPRAMGSSLRYTILAAGSVRLGAPTPFHSHAAAAVHQLGDCAARASARTASRASEARSAAAVSLAYSSQAATPTARRFGIASAYVRVHGSDTADRLERVLA